MTALVHGDEAATAAREAADVLFGADPTAASHAALDAIAAEVPSVDLPLSLEGVRVHEMLVQAGVAKSNGEVSRLLDQGAVRAGNRVLDVDGLLSESDLLRGQFLLLRKGKRDFVVGKSLTEG
jgi:tyrosyl-tRNA synthetase